MQKRKGGEKEEQQECWQEKRKNDEDNVEYPTHYQLIRWSDSENL